MSILNKNTETLIGNEISRLKKNYPELNHIKLDIFKDQIRRMVRADIQAIYRGIKISETGLDESPLHAFVESLLKVKFSLDRQAR